MRRTNRISIWHFILGIHGGGVENVIYNYFSHMDLELYDLHIVVHMPIDENKAKKFRVLGFNIHELSMVHAHKIRVKNLIEYEELFKNNEMDIVHNHFPNNLLPLFFAKRHRVKGRILHSHVDYSAAFIGIPRLKRNIYNLGFKFNVGNATDLFSCGKQAGKSCYGSNDFKVITNAIEVVKFRYDIEDRNRLRADLNISDNDVLIGNVGRFEGNEKNQKNQKYLITLFSKYHKAHCNSKLIFIGDGPLKIDMVSLCEELGIGDDVIFTGYVNDVHRYYSAMDVFVFPSIFEGFSIATIEAQCSGLPGIISDRVSSEMNIIGLFKQLSLDASSEDWIRAIEELAEVEREDSTEKMRRRGYDINNEAVKLDRYYKEMIGLDNE